MPLSGKQTLLERLITMFPDAKRQTLRTMVERGRVTVNGLRARRVSTVLASSDQVVIAPHARIAPTSSSARIDPLQIVFEDEDLLIVDKPAGLLTSTVAGEKRLTALKLVRGYMSATSPGARVGLIHRLDRDASGLLVFSKSHRAYKSLKTQFFKHSVERIYLARVRGTPGGKRGTIDSRLIERADGTVRSSSRPGVGQRAVTEFEVRRHDSATLILRVRLRTGRKHQIRVHLSERGCPIVGDSVYGGRDEQPGPLALRAVELALDHPVSGKRMTFNVPPGVQFD